MFKHIKIKTLIVAALGLLTLLMVAVGSMGIYNGRHAVTLMRDVVVQDKASDANIARIRHAMEANRSQVLLALQHNPASEHSKMHDHPVSVHLEAIAANTQKINDLWTEYSGLIRSPEEKTLAEDWRAASGNLGAEGVEKAVAALRAEQWEPAIGILLKTINPAYNLGQKAANSLSDFLSKRSEADTVEVVANLQHTGQFMVAILVLGVLFAVAVGVLLLRAIVAPLADAIEIANRVAKGDLTQEIDVQSKNEIGQLLQAMHDMAESLGKIVAEVRVSTETVAAASNQIVAGNLDLSARTEQQAASIEETASSMEQMTSTVRLNADHAREANELARSASEVAGKGGEMVADVVETMDSINDSARKIADIIGVIDGIAFQTNILALNAAVEAARAGEQGRGFAVVASEVRTLAQRSANAAKEIKELIGASVEKVSKGTTLVGQTGQTMHEIVAGIAKVAHIMSEITHASEEQTAGIGQINSAVAQMDQTTQQNAALVEESAAAAQSMRDQAAKLTEAVSVFRVKSKSGFAATDLALTAPAKPEPASTARASIIPIPRQPVSAPLPQATGTPRAARVANADWEEF